MATRPVIHQDVSRTHIARHNLAGRSEGSDIGDPSNVYNGAGFVWPR